MGITGHRKLSDPAAWTWVRDQLTALLRQTPRPLIGLTALAIGADQLFAEVVLELNGEIELLIPFPDYEQTFDTGPDLARYRRLKALARKVETEPACASREAGYLKAGQRITDLSDLLLAVWDGEPSRGLGGTADIVDYAARIGKPAVYLNPISRRVEHHPVTHPPSAAQKPQNH